MMKRFGGVACIFFSIFILCNIPQQGTALDCFKCISTGGDNEACDDPFHNNGSLEFLESPCLGGRKGRDGLFPATACMKIAGIYDESGLSLTIRGCALDSGTLTTDSELIRMSHCGGFYYEEKYVRGCVQSCSDSDACNRGALVQTTISTILPMFIALATTIPCILMRNRVSNVCDQLIDFSSGIINWLWDTIELVVDIILEFIVRGIELVIAILHLAFQVIGFLRDLCIEAMQTFAGVFRGFVNIVSSIRCEDVEDFATACIVVILWIGAVKITYGILEKRKAQPFPNPRSLLARSECRSPAGENTNLVNNAMKKKGCEARRGGGRKRTNNCSMSSSSSESND